MMRDVNEGSAMFSQAVLYFTRSMKTAILTGAAVSLVACGGGSGSGGGSAPNVTTELEPSEELVAVEQAPLETEVEITSTSQLKVPEGLTFRESSEMQLSLTVPGDAYLSVCLSDGEDVMAINYNDCMLRSWVRVKSLNTTLDVPKHINQLTAAVLIPSVSQTPSLHAWQREQGMSWSISL